MTVLFGTQVHRAPEASWARQMTAMQSWATLTGVERVNLQFAGDDSRVHHPHLDTLAMLTRDSRSITGMMEGPRKPVVSDMCDALAIEAERRGCAYFCFANPDIIITQDAVSAIVEGERDGYAFSRMDVDPATGKDVGILLEGVDAIAFRTAWWRRNRTRFSPFLIAEPCWDGVYTGVLMRHGNAAVLNLRPLIRHMAHPPSWSSESELARYNYYLTARNARMFSLWCAYVYRRRTLQAASLVDAEAQDFALQQEVFRRPWPAGSTVLHAARAVKAWASYKRFRLRSRS